METNLLLGYSNTVSADTAPWIRQKTSSGDTIIGARAILNQGLEMADAVFFILSPQGDIVERKDAARAYLRDGHWELQDVKSFKDGTIRSVASDQVATNLRPEFVQERLARPETIPFYDLPGKIEVARSFGLKANAFAMQFDSLVALPFLLVAMTLIAATVSMRFARMGQSVTMILGGVVAGFLLYVVSVLVKAFGVAGFVPTAVAAWVPVVVAMFFGVTFLLYKEDG
jgi:lipopolysaccharide export system permease protein